MVVINAPETPIQAEIIFVIEATSANSAYITELRTNYIVPTLEYFHGGALEEGAGCGSVYGIVAYKAADCHPGLPIATYGPFTCPKSVVETVDKIQYIGGNAENRGCITEALSTALSCFDELGRTDLPMHILLICCSPPYSAYAGGLVPQGAPATVEQAARLISERGAHLSIASAKRLPALMALYEHAGGELHQAQQRNYAKDPRHLVLTRGYSLKERPPSPAPKPAPDVQPDMYGQTRATAAPPRGPAAPQFQRDIRAPVRPGWMGVHPQRQPIYANNSALLTQLAQPSYPPPPPAHAAQGNMQRMPSLLNQGAGPSAPGGPPTLKRTYIWSGILEWMEKGKTSGDQQKVTKHLPCQVSANSKDVEPELKVETWPNKLLMQLMPKQLISNIGGQYLRDSKSVLFHLQPNESVESLTKVMVNGYAGCVHFSPMSSPPQCDIKVLILLYTPDKKAYLGFIPNNQATFVERLRKVIQQQKITQIIKQGPAAAAGALPSATIAAGSGGMPSPSMGPSNIGAALSSALNASVGVVGQMSGPTGPGMVQPQMQPHTQQTMMISNNMGGQVGNVPGVGVGGKGPRPVTQLDGLEAARQQNLEKIQHLQQTLEAAHQQEAQFKSQMDIMSHLHAAQQQEQHYKQLEEQRKQQLQQQQQQQLQQQLRGGAGHTPRVMQSVNQGLRNLLQQPQYRPAGGAVRPTTQPQQFDEVNNYNDFL